MQTRTKLVLHILSTLIACVAAAVPLSGLPDCQNSNMSSTVWPNFSLLTLSGGVTYRYIHIRPQADGKPYILFVHGFPSSSYDWRHQIEYFKRKGYGVIVPDLLGYGGTDKPQDVHAYRAKKMAGEIVGILDHEGIQTVLGVGHDWGSFMLSRLANYYPSRFLSYAFLDVPYNPPGLHFDLDAINNETSATMGYPIYGYWKFFNETDAAYVLDAHADSFFSIVYPNDPNVWKTQFAPVGALRTWLTYDLMIPKPTFVSDDERQTHNRIFLESGGYGPSLNWYKVHILNLNEADEKGTSHHLAYPVNRRAATQINAYFTEPDLPQDRYVLQQPVLLITGDKDPIILANVSEQTTRQFAPDLTVRHANSGHWTQLETKDAANSFLEEHFMQVLGTTR